MRREEPLEVVSPLTARLTDGGTRMKVKRCCRFQAPSFVIFQETKLFRTPAHWLGSAGSVDRVRLGKEFA